MRKTTAVLLDGLQESAKRPKALVRGIEHIVRSKMAQQADALSLRDQILARCQTLGIPEHVARKQVSLAFLRCGIRLRAPGAGPKRQGLLVKGTTITCSSAIRSLERLFGVTTDPERIQLARFLSAVSLEIKKRQTN